MKILTSKSISNTQSFISKSSQMHKSKTLRKKVKFSQDKSLSFSSPRKIVDNTIVTSSQDRLGQLYKNSADNKIKTQINGRLLPLLVDLASTPISFEGYSVKTKASQKTTLSKSLYSFFPSNFSTQSFQSNKVQDNIYKDKSLSMIVDKVKQRYQRPNPFVAKTTKDTVPQLQIQSKIPINDNCFKRKVNMKTPKNLTAKFCSDKLEMPEIQNALVKKIYKNKDNDFSNHRLKTDNTSNVVISKKDAFKKNSSSPSNINPNKQAVLLSNNNSNKKFNGINKSIKSSFREKVGNFVLYTSNTKTVRNRDINKVNEEGLLTIPRNLRTKLSKDNNEYSSFLSNCGSSGNNNVNCSGNNNLNCSGANNVTTESSCERACQFFGYNNGENLIMNFDLFDAN